MWLLSFRATRIEQALSCKPLGLFPQNCKVWVQVNEMITEQQTRLMDVVAHFIG